MSATLPTRESARSFLVGTVVAAVLAVIVYIAFTANEGRLPGESTTTVRAVFADVGQLQTNSEVRENGVYVGRVSAIELRPNDTALVTMSLNGDIDIHRDAYAGIWDQSALAQKFVELRRGTAGSPLLGEAEIPVGQTESTHDLVQVLDVLDAPTRAALARTVRTFGTALGGRGADLNAFTAGRRRFSTTSARSAGPSPPRPPASRSCSAPRSGSGRGSRDGRRRSAH